MINKARYSNRKNHAKLYFFGAVLAIVLLGWSYLHFSNGKSASSQQNRIEFDATVNKEEQQKILVAAASLQDQDVTAKVSVSTSLELTAGTSPLDVFVLVTDPYSTIQKVSISDLGGGKLYAPESINSTSLAAIARVLSLEQTAIKTISDDLSTALQADMIAIIPIGQLSSKVKLLSLNNNYYLDTFSSGAVFRMAKYDGEDAQILSNLKIATQLPDKNNTLKINMTGVTALTRRMLNMLGSVESSSYFGEKIAPFLAEADVTHISNEVSFADDCQYSHTVFCSSPGMLQVLKDSGVDVVELTGNHNNDVGSMYNTESINLYHSLGWGTFGGGLNSEEASKPYLIDQKDTKVAFFGYNYPDSPNGNPIADTATAGANSFDVDKIKSDIKTAKDQGRYVIVDIQFWECYAYPDGYIEFPVCDSPIANQRETFRQMIDLGADMVVGSSAHQPQTYELYKGKPIYFGLGNLYFEQIEWPGTERGIILTHYFNDGVLLQTKLTPTVYDAALQTRIMTDEEAASLLTRLKAAR